jgi:hypothetical protein
MAAVLADGRVAMTTIRIWWANLLDLLIGEENHRAKWDFGR